MPVFAVTMVAGPSWDGSRARRQQDGWDDHAAFMDGLVESGFVVLGGPVGDGSTVLLAVEAPDADAVRRILAEDPWAPAGILRIGSLDPWTIWLDGRRAARSTE